MRETKFIEQNKEKWRDFELTLGQKHQDPDKLSKLFIEVTDDLSYARTHYGNRSVNVYLNSLAQKVFYQVYRNKRGTKAKFIEFWVDELPRTIYESRKAFYLSTIVFTIAFIIGVVSSMYDPDFAEVILGKGYIDMTLENIENGDPMGVYKDSDEVGMFLGITLNNLKVDIITFISGLFASIGTLFVMIYNGIMVGTFQYFFIERGLFWESFLTIWMHGSLEIPTIIISGAAGLVFGSGWILPGTYSRFRSFLISARRGVKLLLGVFPITVVAGFIEGFLTRYTEIPPMIRGLFILLCFSSILFYYVYYPWYKNKEGFNTKEKKDELAASTPVDMPLNKIRSVGQIFADTFSAYSVFFGRFFSMAFMLAAAFSVYFVFVVQKVDYISLNYTGYLSIVAERFTYLNQILKLFLLYRTPILTPALVVIVLSTIYFSGSFIFKAAQIGKMDKQLNSLEHLGAYTKKHYISVITFTALFIGAMFIPGGLLWLLFIPVLPFLVMAFGISIAEQLNPLKAIARAFTLTRKNFADLILLHIVLSLISLLFLWLSSTTLITFYFEAIQMNFLLDETSYPMLYDGFMSFISIMGIILIQPIYFLAYTLFFYRSREISEAPGLFEQISRLGAQKRVYGFEQEA